jgi:hypothetical protein
MTKIYALLSLALLFSACAVKEFGNLKQPEPLINQKNIKIEVSQDFVQGSEDVPLLVGMEKIFEESLGFDSASGSIMSSSYETEISAEKIESFYQKTLPQMGWKIKKTDSRNLVFKRENENLEIELFKASSKSRCDELPLAKITDRNFEQAISKNSEKCVIRFFISSTVSPSKKL